jgi:hypothetical protein
MQCFGSLRCTCLTTACRRNGFSHYVCAYNASPSADADDVGLIRFFVVTVLEAIVRTGLNGYDAVGT